MFEMLLTLVAPLIVLGTIESIMPYVMRKNICFGVMLPEEANQLEVIQKLKKQFSMLSIALTFLSMLPIFVGFLVDLTEEQLVFIGTIMIFVFLCGSFLNYYRCHRQVKALKQQHFNGHIQGADARIMIATDFRQQQLIVSNVWFAVIGMLIILITILVPILFYDRIPEYVPIHWGANGEITRWVAKSPRVFMVLPFSQMFTLLILLYTNYTFKSAKQFIIPKNPKASREQNQAYRYVMSKFIVVVGIVTLLTLMIPQFAIVRATPNMRWFNGLNLGLGVLLLASILYIAFKYGQGGERYRSRQAEANSYRLVDDDRYWKLGVFYCNPNDPALFVEKRFGIGLTVNLARPGAWALIVGIIVLIVLMAVIPTILI